MIEDFGSAPGPERSIRGQKPKKQNCRITPGQENMKKQIGITSAAFVGLLLSIGSALAVPVSVSGLVDDVSAQATMTIGEALPFVAIVIGGVVLFKLVRKFIR